MIAVAVTLMWAMPAHQASADPSDPNQIALSGPSAAQPIGIPFGVGIDITRTNGAWVGYQVAVQFDATKLAFVPTDDISGDTVPESWHYTGLGGTVMNVTVFDVGGNPAIKGGGSALSSGTTTATGNAIQAQFKCIAPTPKGPPPVPATIRLVTLAEDGVFGTSVFTATPGDLGATDTVDITVTCQLQSDWVDSKTDSVDPVVAGAPLTYTTTYTNAGPNPSFAVLVGDDLQNNLTYVSNSLVVQTTPPGPPPLATPCIPGYLPAFVHPVTGQFLENLVLCDLSGMFGGPPKVFMPGDFAQLTVNTIVPVTLAGTTIKNAAQGGDLANFDPAEVPEADCAAVFPLDDDGDTVLDEDPIDTIDNDLDGKIDEDPPTTAPESLGCEVTVVEPAVVSAVKAGPDQALTGDPGVYTITVSNAGPSPASNVVVTDTLPAGVTPVSATWDSTACAIAAQTVTCNIGSMAAGASVLVTINVTFDTAGDKFNACAATWVNGSSACEPVKTLVLPPYNGMVKDARPDQAGIQDKVNLWLCNKGPDCVVEAWRMGPQIGKGVLDVAELLFLRADTDSPNDSDILPEGLAAYEEQLKYEHKIFDITVADAGQDGLDNDKDGTIDEVGSTTSGGGPGYADGLDDDGDTLVDEADEIGESVIGSWRGNINCSMTIMTENWIMYGCVSAGQQLGNPMPVGVWLKTIRVTPDPDMFLRVRPTKDNGVVSTLIDENCEVADIYASEPWPSTLPGGLTEDCTDLTVTVRMLEGDLNLDCMVNVQDEQAIAFRYGSSFGLLLYDKFFDLEPKLTDFDIDIKDLQFVFGRDGSKCQAPIPNQDPSPAIPYP